jgi:hypothetical protein
MQQVTKGGEKEVKEVPSVCTGDNPADAFCCVCGDKFEEFFNDDLEEWQLRGAIRVDGKTFHPLCYEDYKVSIFVMMLRLLLERLFCHFDKMLVLPCWLHGPLRTLTSFMI